MVTKAQGGANSETDSFGSVFILLFKAKVDGIVLVLHLISGEKEVEWGKKTL
jgi:hypothetical protein